MKPDDYKEKFLGSPTACAVLGVVVGRPAGAPDPVAIGAVPKSNHRARP
jgi:hypothetical protein